MVLMMVRFLPPHWIDPLKTWIFHAGLGLACFYGLGDYPLLDNNEGLYAALARDMALSGDWVIPRLNGVPYLEKPPLLYWLMACSFRLFGINAWAARVIPACAAYGILWRLSAFCQNHVHDQHKGHHRTWVWMMASTLSVWVWSRMVLLDMVMTFWLTQSLLCFYTFWRHHRRSEHLLSWAFLAGAVLTKGFVALILWGLVVGSFLLWQRASLKMWWSVCHPYGLGLFLLLIGPWHILASLRDPHFAFFYFINEHILRFLDMREPRDYYTGSWYYYIPRLILMTWPWWVLWLSFCASAVRFVTPWRDKKQSIILPPLRVFSGLWGVMTLIFFSLSRAKANYYMLAGLPAIFLTACTLNLSRFPARVVLAWGSLCVFLTQGALILWGLFNPVIIKEYHVSILSPEILVGSGSIVLLASGVLYGLKKRHDTVIMISAVMMTWVFWMNITSWIKHHPDLYSSQSIVQYLPLDRSCFLFQEFEDVSSLAFYHPQPWIIVDSRSRDLLYGQTHDPGHSFMTMHAFNQRTEKDWVVIHHKARALFFETCTRAFIFVGGTHHLSVYAVEPHIP